IRGKTLRTGHDVREVFRTADGGDHDIPVGQVRGPIDDPGAELYERLSLGPGAVVHREVAAVLEQPGGQHRSHSAGSNPADRMAITLCRGHATSPPTTPATGLAQTFVYHSSRDFDVSTRHAIRWRRQ